MFLCESVVVQTKDLTKMFWCDDLQKNSNEHVMKEFELEQFLMHLFFVQENRKILTLLHRQR